jgi:hypothetical protein
LAALPDDVDAAGAGDDDLPFEEDELSFAADDEPSLDEEPDEEEAVSDAVADLRLSVR